MPYFFLGTREETNGRSNESCPYFFFQGSIRVEILAKRMGKATFHLELEVFLILRGAFPNA